MKLNFTYGATREGEIFIRIKSNYFFCEIAPMGLDISSIPEEHKGEFIKKRYLNKDIKKLILNTFEENNIWNWPKDYNEASGFGEVNDGDWWDIEASFDNKKVNSKGACCYPDGYENLISMFNKIFDIDFHKEFEDE